MAVGRRRAAERAGGADTPPPKQSCMLDAKTGNTVWEVPAFI